jgi:hypothetical protein
MRRILAALAALLGVAVPVSAATVPYRTDAELVAISDRVVRGRVLDSVVERAPSGAIRTRTRVAVTEDFTGGTAAILVVLERGGSLSDGTTVWIPGAPRFEPGDDVVLCLARTADGYRTVSMAFSAFRVGAAIGGEPQLTRFGGVTVVGAGGAAEAVQATRGLDEFRRAAAAVTGVAARAVLTEAQAAAAVAGAASARVEAPFTLLGTGFRWQQADSNQAIAWYRNSATPSPIQGADTDTQIRAALAGWTDPPSASITLAFAGTRNVAITPPGTSMDDPYCTAGNLGVGLITFGDPLDELEVGTLAIGGGCASSSTHVINGQTFRPFTHGLVVLNDDAALEGYRTAPNITRILEHEVGHGIGLGHTDGGQDNIMYPSCCAAAMPIPPAIGADDLAGLVFIYPPEAQLCTYAVSPQVTSIGPAGGEAIVTVIPSRSNCAWRVTSNAPWIIPIDGGGAVGTAAIRLAIRPAFGSTSQRSGTLSIATATATVVQAADTDADNDQLPDAWETFFGLNPASAAGDQGWGGDPDHDFVPNGTEYAMGSHPVGVFSRYLAEGAANAFFHTELAFYNPRGSDVTAWLRIQPEAGAELAWPLKVPAHTVRTLRSPLFEAIVPGSFATVIESDTELVIDRTMRWDGSGYGSHSETAIDAPSTTWYLAEGSTSGDFVLFYLLQNPGNAATTATVRFLRPAGQSPIERTYTIAPRARLTIPVDTVAPELANGDVSGVVTSTQPIIVERAMYLNRPGQPFAAGHESAGVTAAATEWFLAEGATGSFFDLFVLIENPGTQTAAVHVDYLLPGGGILGKNYAVAPESRYTIYVDAEELPAGSGQRPLASTAVSMRVTSTNGTPIIVERSMWWPQPNWYEAHNVPATTRTSRSWAIAGGYAGGPNGAETYVLIANTGAEAVSVSVGIAYEDDSPLDVVTVNLPGNSRTNVPVGATFPRAAGQRFAIVVSNSTGFPPLVVERATYESPGGVTWAAGNAAVATPLP